MHSKNTGDSKTPTDEKKSTAHRSAENDENEPGKFFGDFKKHLYLFIYTLHSYTWKF